MQKGTTTFGTGSSWASFLNLPFGDICYAEQDFQFRSSLTTQTSCTTTTPRRLIDRWHATSSLWLTITLRSIIAQDPLIGQMHYLEGQITIKRRRTTAKLPLHPHPCLLNSSEPLYWMPKLRLTIRRIEINTLIYRKCTIEKKKQDFRKWEGQIAVVSDAIRKELLWEHHDHPMAGHPGAVTTYFSVRRRYRWPGLEGYIQKYVKGCTTCQQNKSDTQKKKPPLFPIKPKQGANSSETIVMDWITKLPLSLEFDSILTITDHDCSKVVLLISCKEAMGTEDLVKIYYSKMFPHFGIPSKIISDRDLRLTLKLAQDICTELGVQQNISTTYHPQTDRQSERTCQTVKTYLRIFCNEQQTDWARWLPLAQYALNLRPSHTTKIPPFELLIGVIPKGHANSPEMVASI